MKSYTLKSILCSGSFLFTFLVGAQEATLEPTLELKTISQITVPVQSGIPYGSFEKQTRPIINLAGTWKKQRFASNDNVSLSKRDAGGMGNLLVEAADREKANYDDSSWETKELPSVENVMNGYQKAPEYYEDGVWYRRSFDVSSDMTGKKAIIKFLAVNYIADVWINGHYVGWHEGGYTSFMFDVSNYLNYGQTNTIAVRVDNIKWGTRNDIVPYTIVDWFNYTGILHDVYLEFTDPVSVSRADAVTKSVSGDFDLKLVVWNPDKQTGNISVNIEAFLVNTAAATIQTESVSGILGSQVAINGNTSFELPLNGDSVLAVLQNLSITKPGLWTPKKPNLYALKVTLKSGDKKLDEFFTEFGIRKVEVSGNKINLNGIPTFFTAVARHEDHPTYGRSVPKSVIASDMDKVKSVNANLLRTAHYPNHPFTYLMMDRKGIAAIEEIPVWWFDTPLPWQIQNERRHIHEQMWREMIFRDYNRPSILLWSATNECKDVTNRKIFIDKIHTELDTQYPDGRLVTQSAATDRPGPEDASQYSVDVPGWTMYFGVFYGNDQYIDTKAFIEAAKAAHPNTPIIATEFGKWSSENHSGQGVQNGIFTGTFDAFAEHAARSKLGVLNPNGALAAATWWCIFDWYQHANPTGFQSMGIFQMDRTTPKQVADILKNRYSTYNATGPVNTDIL